MDLSDKKTLIEFTTRWLNQFDYAPQSEELHSIPSPCILKTQQLTVFWRPFILQPPRDLSIVEEVVGITLHPCSHIFYGTQYAGNMAAKLADTNLTLIQTWNDDDFSNLERNLIAHLSQQKKLKRVPTIFIAATDEDTEIISLNNLTGEVVKEDLITGELITLSQNLTTFLNKLIVIN
ncbi:SecY-interacting protein [Gilliamella sp. B2776]|uniref:SecY-interacting protein n=1 Tax=unclassified Gilliamella TaxID=2685620 RepID=UPI00226AE06A|nr:MULTISPECIES: SecY-interacting protein [unclassified Gilliamella]MCX8650398.1 SecY-interacting protein [Gilliamella sp. B2779]MCX8654629.1 SecY-interacting protein [Gilliamella sp. B2737]MCX8665266.1 SecY-interacting protein [Gilliamella sp. B2887]MCX8692171.1 SecY-interacting protein [Gilliamella sp. B2776]MCX8699396.1 SecY-interacting protein [Gilliamella sp. B3000]